MIPTYQESPHATRAGDRGHDSEDLDRLNRVGAALFGLTVVCFGLFSIAELNQPLLWLLGVVPDDAFYYLNIARHLADSGRSSFDGITTTNGYHPAWMILLTVLARFIADRELLLRSSLALALLIHLITACLLVRLYRRRTGAFWAWIAGACWMLNPLPLLLALQGMEASLNVLALTVVVLVWEKRIVPLNAPAATLPRLPDLVLLGLSLCLAFWARTEGILLAALTLAWMTRLVPSNRGIRTFLRGAMRIAGAVGGTFALGVLPWFIFSKSVVGAWSQDSGAMKLLWAARQHAVLSPSQQLLDSLDYVWRFWFGAALRELTRVPLSWLNFEETGMVVFLLAGMWFLWRNRPDARIWTVAWLLSVALVAGTVYGVVFDDKWQNWYLGEPGLILYLVGFGIAVDGLQSRFLSLSRRATISVATLAVTATIALCGILWFKTPIRYPWQIDVYLSEESFETLIPQGERIGCFNAGIPGYFSKRVIVNLDGLVNSQVRPYWRAGTFERYLRDQHITYIIDEDHSMTRAQQYSSTPISLVTLASHPRRGWVGAPDRHLWRVDWPER